MNKNVVKNFTGQVLLSEYTSNESRCMSVELVRYVKTVIAFFISFTTYKNYVIIVYSKLC